jgi:aspartyl protease family protein
MATGFMVRTRIIALAGLLACAPAAAADVALIGVIGEQAAVLAVGGGEPKTVKVGQKWRGVTVLAVERGRATVEIDGARRTLALGQHYRSAPAGDGGRQSVTLAADTRGHFVSDGAVNGVQVRFLVDTGASVVALPAADASRLGIDYRKGERGEVKTAGGTMPAHRIILDRVRLGGIELTGVEGIVLEQGLDIALLGMSFLNRVEMKRDGQTMTLTRRF